MRIASELNNLWKGVIVEMAKDKYYGKTLRKNFARHEEVMAMPNLLEIQKKSYQWFLDTGLREVFADVASIVDYAGNLELSFIDSVSYTHLRAHET